MVIGRQRGALEDAAVWPATGLTVIVMAEPVTGEAREAAVLARAARGGAGGDSDRPTCVLSSGETTVTVRGTGGADGTRNSRARRPRIWA